MLSDFLLLSWIERYWRYFKMNDLFSTLITLFLFEILGFWSWFQRHFFYHNSLVIWVSVKNLYVRRYKVKLFYFERREPVFSFHSNCFFWYFNNIEILFTSKKNYFISFYGPCRSSSYVIVFIIDFDISNCNKWTLGFRTKRAVFT